MQLESVPIYLVYIEIGTSNLDLQNVVGPKVLRPKLLSILSLPSVEQIVEPNCKLFREKIEVEITCGANLTLITDPVLIRIFVLGLQSKTK